MDAATIRRARERVGSVLREKWHLDKLIGVGGMAAVYAATHRNKKRGAVKLMHAEISANEDTRSRFLREGYVANHVDHPGAVSVLDDDVAEDGSVYLVMELLEGRNLEHILRTRASGRFEIGEVLAVADAALDVLAAAHDKGIVHRDIKPDNLFITKSGQLKVLDFGIARVRKEAPSASDTATGVAIGTPMYMPPEQALGEWNRVDGRTDVWAIGASMFAILSGREVRNAENLQKLFLAAMTEPIDPLASVAPDLPPEICALVDRAVAFKMEARFESARAMQAAVRALRGWYPGVLTCDAVALDTSGAAPAAGAVQAQTPPAYTPSAFAAVPGPGAAVTPQGGALAPVAHTPARFAPVTAPGAVGASAPVGAFATAVPSTTPGAPVPMTDLAFAPTSTPSSAMPFLAGNASPSANAPPAATLPAARPPMNPTPSATVLAAARAPARRTSLVPWMAVGALVVGGGIAAAVFLSRAPSPSTSATAAADVPASVAEQSAAVPLVETAPGKGAIAASSADPQPEPPASAAAPSASASPVVAPPPPNGQRPSPRDTATPKTPPTPATTTPTPARSVDPFSKY